MVDEEGKSADEFSELIKNLRIKMEKSVDELGKLEKEGGVNSGERALWSAYYVWNGDEYSRLEKRLKEKGCK